MIWRVDKEFHLSYCCHVITPHEDTERGHESSNQVLPGSWPWPSHCSVSRIIWPGVEMYTTVTGRSFLLPGKFTMTTGVDDVMLYIVLVRARAGIR
jgi:hypothetical protein